MVLTGLPVRVPVWGRHHLPSVLAAFAVGGLMGLSTERVAAALTRFAPPEGRCSVAECDGVTVVDDSSCPSPTAARAALVTLRDAARCGRRLAVIGEFASCEGARDDYRRLGATAVVQGGVDGLIACGPHAADVVQAAVEAGMPERSAINGRDAATVAEAISSLVRSGDTVLVVGGPTAAMQAVARAIAQPQPPPVKAEHRPHSGVAANRRASVAPYTNPFEVPPLVLALREAGAALPPGSEH
jgi:UDP-N-acetylmuramoyl-tripeptide--D-alanyl-D-alanine ligase